jgi:hypothetical protein
MSLSFYKLPLFLLLLVILLLGRGKRFVSGFATGAFALLAVSTILVGARGMRSFTATIVRYSYGQELLPGHSLDPMWGMGLVSLTYSLFESWPVTLLILLPIFAYLAWLGTRLMRTGNQQDTMFGLILGSVASLALSVQLLRYDLALLLVPALLAVAWYGRARLRLPLYLSIIVVAFYLEVLLRHIELRGAVFNGSSFFFLLLLVGLAHFVRTHPSHLLVPDPVAPSDESA